MQKDAFFNDFSNVIREKKTEEDISANSRFRINEKLDPGYVLIYKF